MPENLPGMIISMAFVCIGLLAFAGVLVKALKNKHAPVKTVKGTVSDKQKIENISKYAGNGKREKYVVVFSVEGKKKSFYVSKFSYNGYKVGEKGVLTYKGDKLISFQ